MDDGSNVYLNSMVCHHPSYVTVLCICHIQASNDHEWVAYVLQMTSDLYSFITYSMLLQGLVIRLAMSSCLSVHPSCSWVSFVAVSFKTWPYLPDYWDFIAFEWGPLNELWLMTYILNAEEIQRLWLWLICQLAEQQTQHKKLRQDDHSPWLHANVEVPYSLV